MSSDNVPDIKVVEHVPDPELIEHVEEILAKAKAGEIRAIAEVTAYRGDGVGNGWYAPNSAESLTLLAELARLQFQLMLAHPGFREEVKKSLKP